ncbi:hypothetical protein GDO78_006629 [Eleutherodactylus coqui]|uniref:Uncharacterized protein n=1 Tax=Eleutherodactylus coqui TaxID=57060 RepID=A0A8J6KEV7_ELECQ|nr:hypothetical protein GDO78_006629 [Eleutherodactylus coqui]
MLKVEDAADYRRPTQGGSEVKRRRTLLDFVHTECSVAVCRCVSYTLLLSVTGKKVHIVHYVVSLLHTCIHSGRSALGYRVFNGRQYVAHEAY